MENRCFTASFSSGKDSTLAVYKAISLGMTPTELIMTYNTDKNISWFHGVPEPVLDRLAEALGISIRLIRTAGGVAYETNFEAELRRQKDGGAEVCIFGDIDLMGHLEWCTARCQTAGIEAFFPLWQKNRSNVVDEFIAAGFTTHITVVNTELMDESYLGKKLTSEVAQALRKDGVDVCGENGEYHTFVSDGPLFHQPVKFQFGEPIRQGKYAILPLEP